MRLINSEVSFTHQVAGARIERGYEQQRYLFRDDGTLTVTALSLAYDRRLARDVVLNIDAQMRPIDCYVRIHHGDRLEGSGWFRFSDNAVEADVWNTKAGLTRERVETACGVQAFSGHPIACDVLLAAAFNRNSSDSVQHLDGVFFSSADPFGATGPAIANILIDMEYLGVETIETLVGALETDHWRILAGDERTKHTHPGEDMWALRDTFVFVQAALPAIGFDYQLRSFRDVQL